MIHFLLIFDHNIGRLVREDHFVNTELALAAYRKAEQEFEQESLVEIVLVGSDSIETVRITHANYFDGSVALTGYFTGV
jgi:hypothetical protein